MTPLGKVIKLLVALTLSGLVAWGLQGCKKSPQTPVAAAPAVPGAQTVELKVTADGFQPERVRVKKGQPVTLRVTRVTDDTCATSIVIPDHGIEQALPLNQTVSVSFTPDKAGELTYGCAMGQMVSGVLLVE